MNISKNEVRIKLLTQRKKINIENKKKWDLQIINSVISSIDYKNANSIFIFVSFNNEVDTHKLIKHSLKLNKKIYVPKINIEKNIMELFEIKSFDQLEIGYYNILEPKIECLKIGNSKIDLVLTPGLAFDRKGNRLGYGGGYYDMYFNQYNNINTTIVALAYNFQILDEIPHTKNDVKMNKIISNDEILNFIE